MNITLTFWQFITLLIGFFGAVTAGAKILLALFNRSLDDRFANLKEAAQAGDNAIHETLKQHINEEAKNSGQLIELERRFLNWKADLPLEYVRREDFIRNQTIIEAKLDGVALKIENAQLKGGYNAQ